MSTITEKYDASAPVAGAAPDGGMGDKIEDLKSQCGFIIPKIDWVVEKLTGFSLLEALLKKISGDFNAVSSMQKSWGQVAESLRQTSENYATLADELAPVWRGIAADAATSRIGDVSDMHADQHKAATYLQEELGHILDVALATAQVVAEAINFIDSVIQEVLADAASGPIGWVKGGISAPGKARKVVSLIHRGLEAIEKFTEAVKAVVHVLRYVNAGLTITNNLVEFGNTAAATDSGEHTDDTAHRGFG